MRVTHRLRTSRLRDRLALLREIYPEVRFGWDVIGAVLAACLIGAVLLAGRRTGSDATPVAALIGVCSLVVVASALIGIRHRAIVPVLVAVAVIGQLWDYREELLLGPVSGPFGYRNATGALLLQGAFACVIAGFAFRSLAGRILSLVPAAAFAALALRSSAATAAGVALAVVAMLSLGGRRGARAAVVVPGIAFAAVALLTIVLAITHRPGEPVAGVAGTIAGLGITERRLDLWHDATSIIAREPGGIGHGAFGTTSPTALADRDTIYAHQELLEQTAELGWVVGIALVLVIAWAFARLAANPRADAVTALAAASFAALMIHGSVDYVLHFPAVPIAAAALFATGIAVPPDEYEDW